MPSCVSTVSSMDETEDVALDSMLPQVPHPQPDDDDDSGTWLQKITHIFSKKMLKQLWIGRVQICH